MSYKFDKDKLITCGIENTLPHSVTLLLWQLVGAHVWLSETENKTVDYLQVFDLSTNTATKMLTVKHKQEQPDYKKTHTYRIESEEVLKELNGLKIFVIDDITHSTMLLAEEY